MHAFFNKKNNAREIKNRASVLHCLYGQASVNYRYVVNITLRYVYMADTFFYYSAFLCFLK